MRTASAADGRRDPEALVTRLTRVLAVTGAAQTRLRARFLRVARAEASPVDSGAEYVVEEDLLRKCGDGLAVTARAKSLAVAGRAQVTGGGGAYAVLAQEVALVDQVALRARTLSGEVDVAPAAVADPKLVFVSVASKAGGHLRAQNLTALRDVGVAANAVATNPRTVLSVAELQVALGLGHGLPRKGGAVAGTALTRVVGPLVAAHAVGTRRHMQLAALSGALDTFMTLETRDALDDMCSVREGPPGLVAKAEDLGTRCDREAAQQDQAELAPRHGCPHRRARRTSALIANSLSGVARTSIALAASHFASGFHDRARRPQGHTEPRP
jgi:hypothetical protein